MSPTSELRFVNRLFVIERTQGGEICERRQVLQQKWVQHHIPAGQTEAPFEWRDVPIVEDEK